MGVVVPGRTFEVVMKHSVVLAVDAALNIVLGVLLVTFPRSIVDAVGVPTSESAFYPSVLGGVLMGIGIALVIQIARCQRPDGLGLWGAGAINLCGGLVLAAWLLWGHLELALRGRIFLWSLVAVLVGVSLVEFLPQRTRAER
jgi:hypothetical protein